MMRSVSAVALNLKNGVLETRYLSNAKGYRYIVLDETLLDLIEQKMPRMSRKERAQTASHLLSYHVPGNCEEYKVDVILRSSENKEHSCYLAIIRRDILNEIRTLYPYWPIYSSEALQNEGLAHPPVWRRGLFAPEKKSPIDKLLNISLSVFVVSLVMFAGLSFWRRSSEVLKEGNLAALKNLEKKELSEKQEELEVLEERWEYLQSIRPGKISRMLEELAVLNNSSLQIESLSINRRFFRLQARAEDALQIAIIMEENPFFKDTHISNIQLNTLSGLQTFSVEGFYAAR